MREEMNDQGTAGRLRGLPCLVKVCPPDVRSVSRLHCKTHREQYGGQKDERKRRSSNTHKKASGYRRGFVWVSSGCPAGRWKSPACGVRRWLAVTVYSSGSGSFFGGYERIVFGTSSPKNVPDPLHRRRRRVCPVNGYGSSYEQSAVCRGRSIPTHFAWPSPLISYYRHSRKRRMCVFAQIDCSPASSQSNRSAQSGCTEFKEYRCCLE